MVGASSTGTTLTAGDNLAGGLGNDKLVVSVSGSAGAAATISGVTLTSIERVEVSNFDTDTTQADTHTFDMSGATGVATVALTSSNDNGDTIFTNLKNIVDAEMSTGGGDLTLTYGSGVALTGTADTQKLALNGVTSAATFTVTNNGFESFAISSTGASSTLAALALGTPTSGTQTITVTGDKNLTITGALASTVKTVDASAFTGNLTITPDATIDTSVTGGSGNDVFNYTTGLTATDTIDGGAGAGDVVSVTSGISSSLPNIKNVEILRMGGSTQAYDVSKVAGIASYQIADATVDITVSALGTGASVSVLGNVTGTNSLGATAASSALTVTLDNATKKEADGIDVAATTLSNVSTLTLGSVGGNLSATKSATNANNIVLGTTTSLTKITVTGDTDLVIEGSTGTANDGTVSALNSTIKTVDATAFTGRLYVTASSSASTITGGTSSDSIVGGSGNDSLVGGPGNDTINGSGGDDNISGGDGNDSITAGAATASTKVVTLDGGAGNDTITLTSGTGYFNVTGGDGNDTVVVSGGTTIYFDSNDTLNGGNDTDTLSFAGTSGAAFDLATNSGFLQNVSGFEAIRLDVSGLTQATADYTFTFNDVLASSIGGGTLTLSANDAATPAANAGATVNVDASGVLLASTKVNFTGSAAVKYTYSVGAATENIVLGAQADTVSVSNIAFLQAADTVTAGAGSDTLTLAYGTTSSTAVTFNTANMTNVTGFETINLDGKTGAGTGAITATLTDAFVTANNDVSTNKLIVVRSQLGSTTVDDTGTTKVDGSAVTSVTLAITGANGNDTLIGGGAADTLTGGQGNDSLTGGAGNDVFKVVSATNGIDTITDMNFGTSTTTVDQLDFSALSLKMGGTTGTALIDTVQLFSASYTTAVDVIIFNTQTYADTTALDTALEGYSTNGDATNYDLILVWQDTLNNVHVSVAKGATGAAATDGGDEYTITDYYVLSGLTLTGVQSLINAGDFVVA